MWSLPTHAGRMRVCEMRACAGWLGASSKLLHYQNPVEVNDSLNAFADGFLTALARLRVVWAVDVGHVSSQLRGRWEHSVPLSSRALTYPRNNLNRTVRYCLRPHQSK